METQSERIKRRRLELRQTQQSLSEKVGVSRVAITQWENDPSVRISGANLSRLSKALGVSGNWILSGAVDKPDNRASPSHGTTNLENAPTMRGTVPLISWVEAGSWTEVAMVETDFDQAERMPRPPQASDETFALRVMGESMAPRYRPGAVIFIDPNVQPENGDDVVALLTESNEATFKRLVIEPGGPQMLMALNEAWPQRFTPIDSHCQILGTVIADMNLRRR